MEALFGISNNLVQHTQLDFKRYLYHEINWNNRLISLLGARGVGKTTLMLQYIKAHNTDNSMLYITAEHLYFTQNTLLDFADSFVKLGGKVLCIDEIHQYVNWAKEIKVIYDSYPQLKIIFSGSSVLDINQGNADLSRRVIPYELKGLSFREYLNFTQYLNLEPISLSQIIKHQNVAVQTPLKYFQEYLQHGYYPFFKEDDYSIRLQGILNKIVDIDLVKHIGLNPNTGNKIKRLLYLIAQNVPFKPNISKLAEITEVSPRLLPEYFAYMEKAGLIKMINTQGKSIRVLAKADKILLNNTNLSFAFVHQPDTGSLRETFFVSQFPSGFTIQLPPQNGDFVIDNYTFEIGGKSKKNKQIEQIPNSFVVKDNIEQGFGNILPLWKFGFLY